MHLANPGPLSVAVGVITSRWLYVLMATIPEAGSDQLILDETLSVLDLDAMDSGDMAGIRIQIRASLRTYEGSMRPARRDALAGSKIPPKGLKDDLKDFNAVGEGLVERLRAFREGGVRVLGSLIVGSVAYGYGTSDLDLTDEEIALIHPGSSTASHETATPYERGFGTAECHADNRQLGRIRW